ncbi:hypothetical protein ACH5RR_009567 [Cinchona calisaya]|uniref:Uncharacterized protein n=1 Tax=Cinchona calisaya TaxID=153742 RepID=A0ABD3AHK5_9GENT
MKDPQEVLKLAAFMICCMSFVWLKPKKRKFFSISSDPDDLSTYYGQLDVKRLCMHSTQEYFEKSWPFCPGVRSLLLFGVNNSLSGVYRMNRISFIFHLFNLLEVLDLRNVNVGYTYPNEIALLGELRYLILQGWFDSVTPAVSGLLNLETLIIEGGSVQLPDNIWKMLKLRVLYISSACFLDSSLAQHSLERSSGLQNLDTFSTLNLSFRQSLEKIMRQLPNIRRLKCRLFKSGESNADCSRIVALDFLSRLESLHLTREDQFELKRGHIVFRFPWNLKKLTLSNMHSSIIPKGGELSNLVVLKLSNIDFQEDTWDMTNEEWEFPDLEFLELAKLSIVRWTCRSDGDDHFPRLRKLVLWNCRRLKEIPSCLGDITTLQIIEDDAVCGGNCRMDFGLLI